MSGPIGGGCRFTPDQLLQRDGRHRFAEQKALKAVAAQGQELLELAIRFHTLGQAAEVQLMGLHRARGRYEARLPAPRD